MNIGMLWLDDDKKRSLEDKVVRAVDYYRAKYGKAPNLCFVNEKAVEDEMKVGKVVVRPVKHVRPMHFWVGVQQAS